MTINTTWLVDQRVFYVDLSGYTDGEAIVQLQCHVVEVVKSGIPPVHLIFDTRSVIKFPTNLYWVGELIREPRVPQTTHSVIIHNNNVIRLLSAMVLQQLNVPFHICTSLEDAKNYLRKVDPSLAESDFA